MSTAIIGIDLGTSTSEVSVLKNGRPELIQDSNGDRIIPSVVHFKANGEIVVGATAKRMATAYADSTIQEIKRFMGTDQVVKIRENSYTPEEISALILKHLKEAAERKLGVGSVRDVVITVPARFENAAREATKRAAQLAGLNAVRIINEPTAAALSYGLEHLEDEKKVLVFDFGGGTLDVTILEMFEGVLDVKTSVGDDRLGGMDVDRLLIDHFHRLYQSQRGQMIPESDRTGYLALKEAAEDYKKQLTSSYSIDVNIPYIVGGGVTGQSITRGDFDHMLAGMLERSINLVDEALKRAGLTYQDIDVILPVGGSSRIPAFRRELERRWGKSLQDYDNPDEAVARGAAIAAGIEAKEFEDDGIMILDVAPHRLGIATIEEIGGGQYISDYFSEIVGKDAKLPAIETQIYTTLYDGQDAVNIRIFEASTESNLCQEHRLIGEMALEHIPKASAGQPISIEFRYTLDGTLAASARCLHAPEVKIDGNFSIVGQMDVENLKSAKLNLDDLWQTSADARRCLPILDQAKRLQAEKPAVHDQIEKASQNLRLALINGGPKEVDQYLEVLTDLLYEYS